MHALWSDAAERGDRPLVVALHGFGSDERDLAGLAGALPDVDLVALRAPHAQGRGFMWFPITTPGVPDPATVDAAAHAVAAWVDDEVAPGRPVLLLGFSQGGTVALQALRHRPDRYAGVVLLSGFVAPGAAPGDDALAAQPVPVFWGRDPQDPVIAPVAVERTSAWLPGHAALTERTYADMSHGISRAELDDVVTFLRDAAALSTGR
ncbi:alpha/beta fold hydrolase [Cellulomonas fimi]|uniref:Alpha/beta fold hydrolase n=1 Tax=Cellulomonas fimi TaxID=1708 RepID=A0A7Y0QGP5_CELFI|nr:alpha/beta fold hydrolase [Cellulomonas fimi]